MAYDETHDVGRFFWHVLRYPHRRWDEPAWIEDETDLGEGGLWLRIPRSEHPLLDAQGTSYEVHEPWRIGRCWLLRVPGTYRALVLGWWGPRRTLAQMLADEAGEAEELAIEEDRVAAEQIRDDFRPEPGHALLPEGWRVV